MLGRVDDDELRWLYGACRGLVAASYEDFGLTPVEAAAFGSPTAALALGRLPRHHRRGRDRAVFFDQPDPGRHRRRGRRARPPHGRRSALGGHAGRYSPDRFLASVAAVVDERSRL